MTNEIHLAFSHPSERSLVTASDEPRDRISLRNHIVEVEIGAFQAERGTTQRICFNIVVEVTPFTGPLDDDVDRILSYDRVTEAIAYELAAERVNLLETLAERVAERILTEPQAMRTFVRIEKLDRGPGALGVEIVRTRRDLGPRLHEAAQERPHPRVIYLSNEAIAEATLTDWIDRLQSSDVPAILCVGPPDTALPHAGHKLAQRRIDLLGIEQNAWVLAGRDPRCKVVATRTELDWAMKNGQICVWAPSKMVLDAAHGASTPRGGAVALALWFSDQMTARELLVVGAPLPGSAQVPVRSAANLDSAI
ncbi:dihydroneopterin aldolase [Puniceibacterium confluentis]|uniref:dihydroneopterin aldolase n=1 Tax=Puniceibacterium confluentis TaxID=1958944 RepID=UPI0011B844A6|nr:dihydroneopterin aldolase [Puniceibacterium confluentis]